MGGLGWGWGVGGEGGGSELRFSWWVVGVAGMGLGGGALV